MRKADDGTDQHVAAGQFLLRLGDGVGFDAGCGDVVASCDLEAGLDVGVGHGGVEEGVVDHFGDLGEGYCDSVRHCAVKCVREV